MKIRCRLTLVVVLMVCGLGFNNGALAVDKISLLLDWFVNLKESAPSELARRHGQPICS